MYVYPYQANDSTWISSSSTAPTADAVGFFFTERLSTPRQSLARSRQQLDALTPAPADVANGGKSRRVLGTKSHKKTRRGVGKGKNKGLEFSLLGNNVNGIRGKIDSLNNTIKFFKKPSFLTIQESKLKTHNVKIPGYQLFFKNREQCGGGGLITAIDENLASIQVSSSEKEILVVEIALNDYKIRVINGYGPQEAQNKNDKQIVHEFWQEMEKQIIMAKNENCKIILQCDANAKIGSSVFAKDTHCQTLNGLLLHEMALRQNLHILNTSELCTGVTTRHRRTKQGNDKSIIDFILVCDVLKLHFEQMLVDEERIHVLTKYSSTKGIQKKIESDHNLLFAKFNIKYNEIRCKTKREVFNFKNIECQKKFFDVTDNTTKLSACFNQNGNSFQDFEWNFPAVL